MSHFINLQNPNHSYFYGFFLADGNLQFNGRKPEHLRGKAQIEIRKSDAELLHKFQLLFPDISTLKHRCRDTNFKDDYESSVFTIFSIDFRKELLEYGLTYGKKSDTISPPKADYCISDFWRGYIDGDGSLGFTGAGIPFLSVVISSEVMAEEYLKFLSSNFNIIKKTSRNKRDNVYNIMVINEDAQNVVKFLYGTSCLSMERKANKAQEILSWERPYNIPKRTPKSAQTN